MSELVCILSLLGSRLGIHTLSRVGKHVTLDVATPGIATGNVQPRGFEACLPTPFY